jgi:hypothetical protein
MTVSNFLLLKIPIIGKTQFDVDMFKKFNHSTVINKKRTTKIT